MRQKHKIVEHWRTNHSQLCRSPSLKGVKAKPYIYALVKNLSTPKHELAIDCIKNKRALQASCNHLGQLAHQNVTRRRFAELAVRFRSVEFQEMAHTSKRSHITRDAFNADLQTNHISVTLLET